MDKITVTPKDNGNYEVALGYGRKTIVYSDVVVAPAPREDDEETEIQMEVEIRIVKGNGEQNG